MLRFSCYSGNPFVTQLLEFCGSLITLGLLLLSFAAPDSNSAAGARSSKLQAVLPSLRRMCMTVLLLMYPFGCNSTFNMLYCHRVTPGGPMVLAFNPTFECYTGQHTRVATAAWLVLLFHVIGFQSGH